MSDGGFWDPPEIWPREYWGPGFLEGWKYAGYNQIPWIIKRRRFRSSSKRSKYIAAILAFYLGMFGIHWFYLGNNRRGWRNIALFFTGLTIFVGWFTALHLLLMDSEKFDKIYNWWHFNNIYSSRLKK